MKILFAASECVPFVKTGGLADVLGALPAALKVAGAETATVLPAYDRIPAEVLAAAIPVCELKVPYGSGKLPCRVLRSDAGSVPCYLLENADMFGTGALYGDGINEGYRFLFFCRAVAEFLCTGVFVPDVLHLNDWQTGLLAPMVRILYGHEDLLRNLRIVFSIHNLRYQGIFSWEDMNGKIGFSNDLFTMEGLEFYGCLNCMKAGIVFSDRVVTVSPSYANEIRTPYYGELLDGLLRYRGEAVSGILNGIDTKVYNPETDAALSANYSAEELSGKAVCKAALQREAGFEEKPETPVIAMITRLTPQKGIDLVERVLPELLRMELQFIVLGDGDRHYADLFRRAAQEHPDRIALFTGMNEGLAHRIYAGSDMFLMPSQFEPCGLSQMIAMRYGSVPVVRETGGLRDTVMPYNRYTDEGTGFSFLNYNAHEMLYTCEHAVGYYYDNPALWSRLRQRGMKGCFGWENSAGKYLNLYESIL